MEEDSTQPTPPTTSSDLLDRAPPSTDEILSEFFLKEMTLLEETKAKPFHTSDLLLPSDTMSYLNHGSFGVPYASTLKLRTFALDLCYRQPMLYHREIVPALVARAKNRACEYLQIQDHQRDGFSFCSISPALFKILEAIQFTSSSIILTTDTLYHSLTDMLASMNVRKMVRWIQVETPAGGDQDAIFAAFETVLRENVASGSSIRLAIFDHISSKPTVLFPVERMCSLCRSLNIPTLVDAAHIPGSIPSRFFAVEKIQPTFHCVTFHKWCNAPRGSIGGLFVNKKDIQERYSDFIDMSSIVVKGGWQEDTFSSNEITMYLDASKPGYLVDGLTQGIYDESTREYENIIVLPHCLDLVKFYENDFQHHVSILQIESLSILQQAWKLTEAEAKTWFPDREENGFALSMLCVPLPTNQLLQVQQFQDSTDDSPAKRLKRIKKQLVPLLWSKYAIEVPVFVWKDRILGVRLSFGRNVLVEDIKRLAVAVNMIIEEG